PRTAEQPTRLVREADDGVVDHGQVGGTHNSQHATNLLSTLGTASEPSRPQWVTASIAVSSISTAVLLSNSPSSPPAPEDADHVSSQVTDISTSASPAQRKLC